MAGVVEVAAKMSMITTTPVTSISRYLVNRKGNLIKSAISAALTQEGRII